MGGCFFTGPPSGRDHDGPGSLGCQVDPARRTRPAGRARGARGARDVRTTPPRESGGPKVAFPGQIWMLTRKKGSANVRPCGWLLTRFAVVLAVARSAGFADNRPLHLRLAARAPSTARVLCFWNGRNEERAMSQHGDGNRQNAGQGSVTAAAEPRLPQRRVGPGTPALPSFGTIPAVRCCCCC